MPRRFSHQGKSLLLGVLILVFWLAAPTFVKQFSRVTFYEFQAPAWTALNYLHDLQDYWNYRQRSKNELIEAGIDLARLQAAYSLRIQESDAIRDELGRLERFFELPSLPDYHYEVARVVRRDLNNWWQTLTIRKGRMHGVEVGQAVVYSRGVIGRVLEVHSYTSVVELISSPRFRSAVHIEGDLRPLEYQGGLNPGLGEPSGLARTIPADIRIPESGSLRLVSSRLGGVFPDGFRIGYLDRIEVGEDGMFQEGRVRLDPGLNTVREVAVLIPASQRRSERGAE